MTADWTECVAQMAEGAGQLAADLAGLPEDQVAEALVDIRDQLMSWLSQVLAEKHASVAVDAFIRLLKSNRAELIASGFQRQGTSLQ
jgi:hypothetical protein